MAELTFTYQTFATRAELPADLLELLIAAEAACQNSYAPYSKFHVGAALKLTSGEIIQGANQENAASPAGLCAERTALYTTGFKYPQASITHIAIAATRSKGEPHYLPITPCGGCRQVLKEFEEKQNQPIQMLMPLPSGEYALLPATGTLLPFSFGAGHMNP